MSNFGSEREANDGVRNVHTGVENFRVRHVNPSLEQLKTIYGDSAKEDTYLMEREGEKLLKVVFHCDNDPSEGEEKINIYATFWINKKPLVSTEKGTKQYINMFGKTNWLSDADAALKKPVYENVGANGTYRFLGDGMRLALRGEKEFIEFFRNLLNLPDESKVAEKSQAASQFSLEDWDKMFNGDFTSLQTIVKNSTNKVGLLLGAKRAEEKVYQDVFTRHTLRQYAKGSKRYTYLTKELDNAINGGAFANTDWGPRDFTLRKYIEGGTPTQANVFKVDKGSEVAKNAFFTEETADAFAPKQ